MSHLHQRFYGPDIIPSFADRDIFACYTGVGVWHHTQYCPLASLNQEVLNSSSTGMQDELPTSANQYSDEDDSYASNDGGEGPQDASTDEESEGSECHDDAENSESDENVRDEDMWSDEDEDGNSGATFKF